MPFDSVLMMLGYTVAFFGSFGFANAVSHRWLKIEAKGMELLGYLLVLFFGFMITGALYGCLEPKTTSFEQYSHRAFYFSTPFEITVSLVGGYIIAAGLTRRFGKINAGWRKLLGFTLLFFIALVPICMAVAAITSRHEGFGR